MGVAWVYPAVLEPDDNGTILVSFPDIPEAHTFGDDEADALRRAEDALVTALEGYMGSRRPIPRPTDAADHSRSVVLPMLTAAKVELYEAMREQGLRKADLARRLNWHGPQVDRLLDLRHVSRASQLQEALAVLNRTLIVRGVGLRPGVALPRRVATGQAFRAARRPAAPEKKGRVARKKSRRV
jgi:antitoxin HicB